MRAERELELESKSVSQIFHHIFHCFLASCLPYRSRCGKKMGKKVTTKRVNKYYCTGYA